MFYEVIPTLKLILCVCHFRNGKTKHAKSNFPVTATLCTDMGNSWFCFPEQLVKLEVRATDI